MLISFNFLTFVLYNSMFFVVALAFLSIVRTNAVTKFKCPQLTSVANFDINQFGTGKFYEIARYHEDVLEKKGECAIGSYNLHGDTAKFEISFIENNKKIVVAGQVRYDNQKRKLVYTHSEKGKLVFNMKMTIVYTDYTNIYMLYNCKYDNMNSKRNEFFWILSRSPTPESDVWAQIDKYLNSSTVIDISKLKWSQFTDEYCQVKNQKCNRKS